jgi:hypothetical protein
VHQGNGQHALGTLVHGEPAVIHLGQQSLALIQLLNSTGTSRSRVTASRTACRSGASSRSVELTKTSSR